MKKTCAEYGGGVIIGDHTFVGAKAFLLPGTVIGDHCLIGAGSVVKGKIPDYSVAYGNPAVIKGDTRELVKRRLCEYKAMKQL